MKVHETRSHAHASLEEEGKVGTHKQKGDSKGQEDKNKKAKLEGDANGKSEADVAAEFDEFCKVVRENLSIAEMRAILEANEQESSGSDDAVVPRCQDVMFYGPLERCPYCKSQLECTGKNYACRGSYNEWTTCAYSTRNPTRKGRSLKFPDKVNDSTIADWVKKLESRPYPQRELTPIDKPLSGMAICLSGRLSRTHQYWREEIEKYGGKVSNTVQGATCLVVNPAERERGGSIKIVDALERNIPIVSEAWLIESIRKQAPQPLDTYDVSAYVDPKRDLSEEGLEVLKLYGKRGVYKDSKLKEKGGRIFEKDGIIYNCAFSVCDQAKYLNEYCILQLVILPENQLYLYYKKGRDGVDLRAEVRLEERSNVDDAVKEFERLFEVVTGNKFESWEREKIFQKKPLKFYPIDMDDGMDVRYGGLDRDQQGPAVARCKLDPFVANFMKVLCSQDIYKVALMEMGHDSPDLPMGMLSDLHLKRSEESLLKFLEEVKMWVESDEKEATRWLDFSNKWFTLMSTRPFTIRGFQELADHVAAAFETVRDINVASRFVGDMTDPTINDPLSDRFKRLGCSVDPLDKESEDYKMVHKYLERTYEPVKVGDVSYALSVENIFAVESGAGPSYNDVKRLPNKVLLWCGIKSSNLLRHLRKGFLPATCQIPVPGYMFGKAIVCSDAAAEAARNGLTGSDRPEGFLVLAVLSMGDKITEMSTAPEDAKPLEEKRIGVKGLGRKKPDESEHFIWRDGVKVPCGRLVPSGLEDSQLEYNEYAVYDPKQVSMRFVVGVKYEEKKVIKRAVT